MNVLNEIGDKAIFYIQQNIDKSEDINKKNFEPLSFNYWFYRYRRKKYNGKNIKGKGKKRWQAFLKNAESDWIGEKDKVILLKTGAMRASISVVKVDNSIPSITVGFNDKESAEKAFYHNVSGAGRGRVLRKFLGLQVQQEQELAEYAGNLVSKDKVFLIGLFKNLGLDIK